MNITQVHFAEALLTFLHLLLRQMFFDNRQVHLDFGVLRAELERVVEKVDENL